MRFLVLVIAIAAFGWGGYWYLGSTALEKALVGWVDERRADGWQAEYAKIDTRGFPNRFDTTFTGLILADPETGVTWTAPFFQILSLSYRPNHVIVVWPDMHSLATPNQTIEFVSESTKGSIVFRPETALTLDRAQFVVEDLKVRSTADWAVAAREFRLATRPATGRALAHDIAITAIGVDPGGWLDQVARDNDLPAEIGELSVDASILFDAPWDRFAVEDSRPQPREIDLRNVSASWGSLDIQMTGKLAIDDLGVPSGALAIRAKNWREMLDLAVAMGAVNAQAAPSIARGLEFLAGISGNPDHINATLIFKGGFVGIGPIPLGPAPRIFIR